MDTMYETPEGFTLPRPLLMPDARAFSDVLEYVREWDHETMSHKSGKIPRPDLVPEPRYIRAAGSVREALDGILSIAGIDPEPDDARNEIGPFCALRIGNSHRGLAVRATDAVIEAVAPRIVTADDHLSFKVIYHAANDRALVILDHGQILGSHWLAYIDPATIPAPRKTSTTRKLARNMADGSRIVATLEIREADHTRLSPGFSVTGELYAQHGTWTGAAQERNGREPDTCGCIHAEILRAFPHLAPVVAVHLADLDGTPMHAEANARYMYRLAGEAFDQGQYSQMKSGYERAARALRVDDIPIGLCAPAFSAFVAEQRERWRYEAMEARQLIESIPEEG